MPKYNGASKSKRDGRNSRNSMPTNRWQAKKEKKTFYLGTCKQGHTGPIRATNNQCQKCLLLASRTEPGENK